MGFLVLQVKACWIHGTPEEGPCNVDGYETAVQLLAKKGLVDPQQVGIIGFSRSCFHVLEALTKSTLHFRAASITDGVNYGYWQYLLGDDQSDFYDANAVIATVPAGKGLQEWLERSPEFTMDKVTSPLLATAARTEILYNWEPCAALRFLNKPVDFIVLNTTEHVLTNPRIRVVSQGTNIDWFRFWLQGYEDPDPSKADQYKRWEHLRELQEAENRDLGQSNQ